MIKEDQIKVFTDYFSNGEKTIQDFRWGIEFEHFIIDALTKKNIPYLVSEDLNQQNIEILLRDFASFLGASITEYQGHLIGFYKEPWSITIEPGAQFELSIDAKYSLIDLENSYRLFMEAFLPFLESRSKRLLAMAYWPKTKVASVLPLPKNRYLAMDEFFRNTQKHGKNSLNMMRGTASLQLSCDFSNEVDFSRKYKAASFLSLILYLLFDTGARYENEDYPQYALRRSIWRNTDPERTGLLSKVFSEKVFTYADYAEFILKSKPIFIPYTEYRYALLLEAGLDIEKSDNIIKTFEYSVSDLLLDKLQKDSDLIEHFLSMVFPDVRCKHFLEIRMIDAIPYPMNFAAIALLKGLFSSDAALTFLEKEANDLTYQEVLNLEEKTLKEGLSFSYKGLSFWDWANKLFFLAKESLVEQEQYLLKPLELLLLKKVALVDSFRTFKNIRGLDFAISSFELKSSLSSQNFESNFYNILPFNQDQIDQLDALVSKTPEKYLRDYQILQQKIAKSSAIYKEKPVPVLYHGLFYTEKEQSLWKRFSDILMGIGHKVLTAYLENVEIRKAYNYSELLESLILQYPGYDMPVPMGRYDIFYTNESNYCLCELNTDGSSAMNEDNVCGALMLEGDLMQDFLTSTNQKATCVDLFSPWLDTLIDIFNHSDQAQRFKLQFDQFEKPNILIADFLDLGTSKEFEAFQDCFCTAGYSTEIADVRDLIFDGEHLILPAEKRTQKNGQDFRVDILYRRMVTADFLKYQTQLTDLVEAYKAQAFCMIGSFRSQLMHDKRLFYFLRTEAFQAYLTEEEQQFIEKAFPETYLLDSMDFSLLQQRKDDWILKPADDYASHGIYIGMDHTEVQWEQLVIDLKGKNYIAQHFYPMKNYAPLFFFEENKLGLPEKKAFGAVLGLFIYGEKFMAPYTRIGSEALISGARSYYTAPNILLEKKEAL